MVFSDEDVKRLKEQMGTDTDACHVPHGFKLKALLARLEAAELCAEHGKLLSAYLAKKEPDAWEQGAIEVWDRRCEAWSKTAGRE